MSLAALKAQIENEKKRKAADATANNNNAGNKFMRRGEEEKLRQKELLEKKKAKGPASPTNVNEEKEEPKAAEPAVETPVEQTPPIPREQVIQRLRQRDEPITLFGESDWMRYQRLKALEDREPIEYIAGMDNEFAREVANIDEEEEQGRKKKDDDDDDGKGGDGAGEAGTEWGGAGWLDTLDRKKVAKHDYVLILLKTMLNEWEQELNDRPDLEKRTAQGKVATATYKQCRKHIKPLFKLLKDKTLQSDILDPVHEICCHIQDREYVLANDAYLQMAIGNAPWPMGVTMVGIHERSAREKIFSNQVAHVLNDETQRKYIQAIKRIMTWAQRRYPNDPSKCVG